MFLKTENKKKNSYQTYPKLFEYTFLTPNYDHCYTLHIEIKFVVNLYGNSKFRVQSVSRSIV